MTKASGFKGSCSYPIMPNVLQGKQNIQLPAKFLPIIKNGGFAILHELGQV
jgi:hypothetical protein